MTATTTTLAALVPDRCNFIDRAFEDATDRFMDQNMPGFPLGLLDTSNYERWELEPLGRCAVECELPADVSGTDMHELFFVIDNDDERHEFAEESDAEYFAQEQNEQAEEGRHGFPWAWDWCFLPHETITTRHLQDAGFVVASYKGGCDDYRLAGIDGGGYSFKGAHFATLYALVAADYGWKVNTDKGPMRIEETT